MFKSIIEDIKAQFRYGNMVNRLIIINVFVFAVVSLFYAFSPKPMNADAWYYSFINQLALPSSLGELIWKPWTLLTHFFLHEGFWHILWNMLIFHWFGRIIGDFLGDNRVLPLYLLGGLMGAVFYLISGLIVPEWVGSYALGASAAVMAFVIAAAVLSPEYELNLILIGRVKIKYIALVVLIVDLIGIRSGVNSGGHIAHLGGAFMGWLYIYSLQTGNDLSIKVNSFLNNFRSIFIKNKAKSPLKVKYKSSSLGQKSTQKNKGNRTASFQKELDTILEKIKKSGYDSLTAEEKEFLFLASKK